MTAKFAAKFAPVESGKLESAVIVAVLVAVLKALMPTPVVTRLTRAWYG